VKIVGLGGMLSQNKDNQGIGKLTLRTLKKGTKKRSAEKLAQKIEGLGADLSVVAGNNSFAVGLEFLNKDVEQGIELLADVALNASFDKKQVEIEKQKQLTDIKMEKDEPMAQAMNRLKQAFFDTHPYAYNILGTEETLNKITADQVKKYYADLLNKNQIYFAVGGSFDQKQIVALLNKHFSAKNFKSNAAQVTGLPQDKKHHGQTYIVPTNKQQAVVQIAYPSIALDHPDRPTLDLVEEWLSSMGSRLFDRIREKQSLAYFVGASEVIGRDPGFFVFYAGTEGTKGEKVRDEILDEIRLICEQGIKKDELKRSKAQLIGKRLLQDQDASLIVYKGALNSIYGLGVDYDSKAIDKIKQLTEKDVNDVLKRYFSQPNYICVIVKPDAKLEKMAEKAAR
jgi:zinc protease